MSYEIVTRNLFPCVTCITISKQVITLLSPMLSKLDIGEGLFKAYAVSIPVVIRQRQSVASVIRTGLFQVHLGFLHIIWLAGCREMSACQYLTLFVGV